MANYLIPEFTMGQTAKVDFSPVTNVLSQYRDQQNRDRAFAENRRQFDASNILAQHADARAATLQPYQIANLQATTAHTNASTAESPYRVQHLQAQIEHLRQQGATEAELLPYKVEQQRAITDFTRSRADYFRHRAGEGSAPPAEPRIGMRADGTPYLLPGSPAIPPPPPSRSAPPTDAIDVGEGEQPYRGEFPVAPMRLGGSVTMDQAQGTVPDIQAGTESTRVPGVVTAKERSDPFATYTMMGRNALRSMVDQDQQRFRDFQNTQALGRYINGRPAPSGYAYNPDMTLRDLKDESRKALKLEDAKPLFDDIATARDIFANTSMMGRGWAHATGGRFNDDATKTEEAYRAVEHAIQNFTNDVRSKNHAYKVDLQNLRFFKPEWHDPQDLINFKLDQLNRIFQGYYGSHVQSGDLVQSLFSKAGAELKKREAANGDGGRMGTVRPPPVPGVSAPQNQPAVDPRVQRMKNKYGLE